jgi:hypothetical protein
MLAYQRFQDVNMIVNMSTLTAPRPRAEIPAWDPAEAALRTELAELEVGWLDAIRTRLDCRVTPPLIHFTPVSLR